MAAGDIINVQGNSFGKKGNYFDGTDDYVLHDNHSIARVAANDTTGTYSAWIYLDNITGTYTVLSAGDNNVAEYISVDIVAGKLQCKVQDAGATQSLVTQTTGNMEARKWHHVVIVNGTDIKTMYVDGSLVAQTNTTTTDPDGWFDICAGIDKFAIGCLEMNGTHTQDFLGAIGQVKYWNKALDAAEISEDYKGNALSDDGTYLQFNVTMEDDGTTDAGLGADNGTLTGNAYYGGIISDWSYKLNANVTGHAAEEINTFLNGTNVVSVIKRGD